jgi:hypothetical protein
VPATYFKITQNFIEKMVEKHDFDKDKLTAPFLMRFSVINKPLYLSHDMGGFLTCLVFFFFFLVVLSAMSLFQQSNVAVLFYRRCW